MSDSIVQATVRVTILGDGGRVDVAVPLWAEITTVAGMYVDHTQCDPVTLHSTSGRPFPPGATVAGSRLAHGDVLVAISGTGLPGRRVLRTDDADDEPPAVAPGPSRLAVAGPLAVAALGLVAAVAGATQGGTAADGAAAGLLLVAVLTALLARGHRSSDAWWLAVVPLLAAAAAAVVATAGADVDEGGTLLAASVVGLVAAAAGGALRTASPGVADDWMVGWIATGLLVAAPAALCLLADWSSLTCWVLVLVTAVVASRIVPAYVVDVPDHVLLDFARLAVTAWTAREQPRRSFRGVVRRDDVESVAARAIRLVSTASVFAATATIAATVTLLTADTSTSRRIGIVMLCTGAGGAMVLGGRVLRARTARRVQRTAGTIVIVAVAVSVLTELGADARPYATTVAILAGAALVVVARMTGRGWTSVRWSRLAETAETLASILVFGSLPLATGLFTWVRVLTSP